MISHPLSLPAVVAGGWKTGRPYLLGMPQYLFVSLITSLLKLCIHILLGKKKTGGPFSRKKVLESEEEEESEEEDKKSKGSSNNSSRILNPYML